MAENSTDCNFMWLIKNQFRNTGIINYNVLHWHLC